MYLLIGYDFDLCCQLVSHALRERGHPVLLTADPLADKVTFRWELETTRSESFLRWSETGTIRGNDLRGVLVRTQGGPVTSEGWAPEDLAYVRTEAHAALLAWLWTLPCPVVNRPSPDLWFRPQIPLPEWGRLFRLCGLPALAATVTNDIEAARRFAEPWGGAVIYTPLTSQTRYPVTDDAQWAELAKVLKRVPACLVEPCIGPSSHACLVGPHVVWSDCVGLSIEDRVSLGEGIRSLGRTLGLDILQVEVLVNSRGPRCSRVEIYPQLECHTTEGQAAIVAGLVEVLEKGNGNGQRAPVLARPAELTA